MVNIPYSEKKDSETMAEYNECFFLFIANLQSTLQIEQ
jgi:hypothetical protein